MTESSPTVLGIGMAAAIDCDEALVLGDAHPTSQAGMQLAITHSDGLVMSADLHVGYMHRNFEKLFESRDYRQLMMLANRYDWFAAFTSELALALLLESALGIVPPERATWSRMLLAEANRLSTALAFLSPVLDGEARAASAAARESLITAQEIATGARVHPMFTRIGGLAAPLTDEALDAYDATAHFLEQSLPSIMDGSLAYASALDGLAVLSRDDVIGFGASGVVARASGLDVDIRRDDPYLAYADVSELLQVPTRAAGDARARYEVLVEQLPVGLALLRASIDRLRALGPGPHDVALPKTVRAPEGMYYGWVEGPLGASGALLASVGEAMPWRLKLRSTSFANAQAMQSALVGTRRDRLGDAVMSFFLSAADIDR